MYGVVLILVLVVTGGAIAFIGDRLGSRIGKKRLSVFGLRPRHTSILITIITGVLITTLTFGVMAAVSENVRTALFGMEKLTRSMMETQSQLEIAKADLEDAERQRKNMQQDLDATQGEVDRMHEEQSELRSESDRLHAMNGSLLQENGALLAQNDNLSAYNQELSASNTELSGQNKLLGDKNTKLTSDNAMLEKYNRALQHGIQTVREGDIVFQAGEVISSGVVRGSRPESEVADDIATLVQLANRNVSIRLGKDSGEEIWIYQPEFDAAVSNISKSPQDMIVRIVAAGNLVRGEPVRTTLLLYKNSIIYKDQEFVISRVYEFHKNGEAAAEQVLMDFLQRVNQAAAARGMLPDPLRGTVGVMQGAEFYDLAKELSGMDGSVTVSAYSKGSTDALGPLRLDLRLALQIAQ